MYARRPRTQSSLAIRGDDGPWFLVNASPDARQQLETLALPADGVRAAPIAGVLLTDAEIDHTAGLLLLRESGAPVRVFGSAGVEHALRHGYPVLEMLERYCGAEWQTLEPGRDAGARRVEPGRRAVRGGRRCAALSGRLGHRPAGERLHLSRRRERRASSPTCPVWRDGTTTCSPASPRATSCSSTGRSGATTSWRASGSRPAARATWGTCRCRARAGRSRRWPACSGPRKVLVHINNTNPILLEDSPEREAVLRAGVEVAYDGLEVQL